MVIAYLAGLGTGILLAIIAEVILFFYALKDPSLKQMPEFKLAEDQNPIDPPRKSGETAISKIDYRRQTASRRLVRGSEQPGNWDQPDT